MSRRRRLLSWFIGLTVICSSTGPLAAEGLMAGVAKRELRLPRPVSLAGYSRRKGQASTGVHDPICVRALVVQEGATRVALVSDDLLIVDKTLSEAVQRRLHDKLPGEPLHLLLTATHTHSGPGAYGRRYAEQISMGHYSQDVFERLCATIVDAVTAASQHLQPVTLRTGAIAVPELIKNRMHDDGPTDPELSMLALLDAQQHPIAVVANYSAHPTTLGASNRQLSADYPGVLARAVEAHAPGTVCLFTAGSVGDQAPVKHGSGFEAAEFMGSQLAQRLIAWLDRLEPPVEASPLAARERTVRLAPARVRLPHLTLPTWLGRWFVDDDAALEAVRIGPVLLLGTPCDLNSELGLDLKRYARQAGYQPIVLSFANDYIGYCLPALDYRSGAYEAHMAFNGPTTGEDLVAELKRMVDALGAAR